MTTATHAAAPHTTAAPAPTAASLLAALDTRVTLALEESIKAYGPIGEPHAVAGTAYQAAAGCVYKSEQTKVWGNAYHALNHAIRMTSHLSLSAAVEALMTHVRNERVLNETAFTPPRTATAYLIADTQRMLAAGARLMALEAVETLILEHAAGR